VIFYSKSGYMQSESREWWGVGWIDGPWVGVVVSIAGARLAGLEHNSRREKGEGQKRKSVL
jgi:hypothetical protein